MLHESHLHHLSQQELGPLYSFESGRMAVRARNVRLPPEVNRQGLPFLQQRKFGVSPLRSDRYQDQCESKLTKSHINSFSGSTMNVSFSRLCLWLNLHSWNFRACWCIILKSSRPAGYSMSEICPSTYPQRRCTRSLENLEPSGKCDCEFFPLHLIADFSVRLICQSGHQLSG